MRVGKQALSVYVFSCLFTKNLRSQLQRQHGNIFVKDIEIGNTWIFGQVGCLRTNSESLHRKIHRFTLALWANLFSGVGPGAKI